MNRIFTLLFLSSVLLFQTGCTVIVGSGPVVEREFTLAEFHGVDIEGSFDVSIQQGTLQTITVLANENIIEKLKVEVMDGVLYISLEPGNYMNYDLEVRLVTPNLESVSLEGSGKIVLGTFVRLNSLDVFLDGSGDIISEGVIEALDGVDMELDGSGDIELTLKAPEVSAKLGGSGDIKLAGSAGRSKLELDGSGDIKAYDLETLESEVSVDGSGSIRVYASKQLEATLNGSGDINYRGEPKVNAHINGSGSVEAD